MENRTHLVILGIAASIVALIATARPADAQTREARGTVTAVTDATLSMKAGAQELTVFVDGKTHLEVRRMAREQQRAQPGSPSPRVNDFFAPGQIVLVRYQEEQGRKHALGIRRVANAGNDGSANADTQRIANGTVKLVTASSLTIDENGRERTFGINRDTNVLARGASTATKAAGGNTTIATFVHPGDIVSISYRDANAAMMASEVRVRTAGR